MVLDEPVAPPLASDTVPPGRIARGLATILLSGSSNQVGAAFGTHAFPAIGPAGVVGVRQVVTAAVLLPTVRPPIRRFTRAQWWPAVALGVVYAVMNLTLYTAIDRIGLGLAVTLEFIGPLGVALAGSRRLIDLLYALAAGIGVYVLVLPDSSTDLLGVGAGLLAASCWAAYIMLNRTAARRLPGLQATAVASGLASVAYLPVLGYLAVTGAFTGKALAFAAGTGLLSSVVPYALDLTVLRQIPARLFGIFMSIHPVLAAFTGSVVLGEVLAVHEMVGIAIVVAANVVTVATLPRP